MNGTRPVRALRAEPQTQPKTEKKRGGPPYVFEEIFEKRGDTPELRQFIQDMAIPITQIANILDPAVIFIAGGVVDMRGFPQKQLDQAAREHMRHPLPADTAKLVFTHHSDRSGVLGAALYAHRQLGAAK